MNTDKADKEQSIDLGLALNYSSQCIQRALNDDSGAGANAGSRVDMTFVATDPLSELVWSPHKGLSLKCADSSMKEKRPSLLLGAGPSNMIHSPPQDNIAGKIISKEPTGEGNLITSQGTLCMKNEMGETNILTCSPRSNAGIKTVYGPGHAPNTGTNGNNDKLLVSAQVSTIDFNQEQHQRDNKEKGIYFPVDTPKAISSAAGGRKVSGFSGLELDSVADFRSFKTNETEPGMAQTEAFPMQLKKMTWSNPYNGIGNDVGHNKALGMEVILTTTEVPLPRQCNTPDTPALNSTSPSRRDEALALAIEEESNNEVKTPGSTSTPLEKPESAAENDLRTQTGENACGAVSKIVASASDHNVKIISQQDEGMLSKTKALPANNSPNKCGIYRHRRKGKGKALSDGDRSGRKSNKEDDSDESVESCNSAALVSTGKRQWGCEQQPMTESKRIRKEINESPGSTSFVRQDSSFMIWISNMMKGLPKPNQDETPSLALTLAHANHDSHDQKLLTSNKNPEPGSRHMGFQSIFQSLYCPNTKVQELRSSSANKETGEKSKEFYLANRPCDNIMSIACHGENNSFKQACLSDEKFNQSACGNGAGPSTQPVENRSPSNPVCSTEKDEVASSSSLGKRKINSPNNNASDPPTEGKTANNFCYKSDLLGSLWVTRFSPKTSSPTLKVDQCNQNADGATELSTDGMGLIPYSQNHFDSFKGLKILETREYCTEEPLTIVGADPQNYSGGAEVSFGFRKQNSQNNQKSIYKLNPILPPQRSKSSEAMTSLFARRLDALKHIMAWNETDDEARPTPTCFFCGIKGHSIRDCSEIKEIELEDLRNNTSYIGAGDPPCCCIRCFQLNHWAVACPSVSKRINQSECGASLINRCSSGLKLHDTGEKRNGEMWKSNEYPSQVAAAFGFCSGKKQTMQTSCSLNEKGDGNVTLFSNSILVKKYTDSSSGEIDSKESQITPLCNFFSPQISDVPKGIFDAIKRLRLSRGDILKWMSSIFPFSNLNGFFLRLRLGKWEEGLGGTGYYVACISEAQKERLSQSSKTPIAVNIGGIKCLVESKYVSNHDFLEDELIAWWGATTRAGGKIPSEEDLIVKLEEKKKLGF